MKAEEKSLHEELRGLRQKIEKLEEEKIKYQRQAEAWRDLWAQYEAMVEAFDGLIYICSQNYEVEFMNQRFIERTGYYPLGQKCYQALHDLEGICPWCVNERVFRGEKVTWEVLSPKDHHWYSIINTPIRHPDGTMSKIALIRDITVLKQTEEALKEAQQRCAEIFDFLPDATFAIDREGKVIAWNRAIEEMTGVKADAMMGKGNYEYALPFYGKRRPLLIDLAFATDPEIERKYAFVHRLGDVLLAEANVPVKGEIRPLWGKARPLYDSKGNIIGAIETIRDLSERKEVEAAFKNLVSSAPMGIFIVQDGRFRLVNPGFQKITGFEEIELLHLDSLSLVAPEFKDMVREKNIEILQGQRTAPFEYQFIDHEGKRKWAMETVTPTQYRGEKAILGFFMDITESKQLEAQFLQAQKLEVVGRLAGGVAHDFNNLLTAIMGYTEIIKLEFHKEDPLSFYLEEIMKSVQQGASLTNQLLAFSRKQILQPQVIDLKAIFAAMDKMLRRLIGEDIDLITFIDQDVGFVKADPGQIEQVIMNLAINARDAMPRGGKLTIEVVNADLDEPYARSHVEVSPGPYVLMAVSDNGQGMERETLSHIFEPFFTTKESGKGTGLGLAIVYGIVKQSGGHIWVYSEPGQGTSFKIYFPRLAAGAEPVKPALPAARFLKGQETVLVVEDDATLRRLISRALEKHGYQVLEAGQGGEALLICEREKGPIHLMLTDVVLPQMSGRELAGRLASLHPEMQVLYMSGYTENAIVHHGVLDAEINFIPKPFKILGLVQKVREVLDAAGTE